ncbi:TolB family protein [Marinagarivorans cellulosilyticus]|uniref:Uncharacterized protein n=1 Tax=Marinagarivorans cellulosilyticus TaxID=2721545 RepID=A0AAN2BMB0_9GAMM|nr:hypothetical protein [Marinagarivorans cellulosilyticus]BCD99887.1 hypothetical protein MARGE09_P4089 [Marinagarivorans cellulosilyticus]
MPSTPSSITSVIEVLSMATGERRTIFEGQGIYEAPNWSRDGQFLIINKNGLLYRLPVSGADNNASLHTINTEFANRCNNDHGISPGGKRIVISHHSGECDEQSVIYTLPINGGTPFRVTQNFPSYWHGWSPDGNQLAYVAGRDGQDFKIYSISVYGGEETQLTFGPGLDDGPDYSHDGKYIYYNSFASGRMQIWRMLANGTEHTQMVESTGSDWFPHPSPDGKKVVFLRYLEDQIQGHPFGRDVQLFIMDIASQTVSAITEPFFGGQGTINVPSWSPDSSEFAFVTYRQG